jgi:hypothetical protein
VFTRAIESPKRGGHAWGGVKTGKGGTSRAFPWFESYADQDRITKMWLRHARLTRELWWQPIGWVSWNRSSSYLMEGEIVRGDTRYYISIISVKRRSFTEGDDETNSSLHTNIAHVTVHSSVSMWDTAQSVAV